jgi:NADH:ubiquinone reductase (H+-translocating)
MVTDVRRDLRIGAVAGLVAGVVLVASLSVQGRMSMAAGLAGLAAPHAALVVQLGIAILLGAGFGGIFRQQTGNYASALTGGLLYGLLWWIVGPLTLTPLTHRAIPTWSLADAAAGFPALIAHLLYGGALGVTFYLLSGTAARVAPAGTRPVEGQAVKIVIVGGGFGGISAAQRLEHLLHRHPAVAITLVSQSNYLLFTPMLAEVAASGLEAQHISAPVRAALARTQFRRADVETIDGAARTVRLRSRPSGQPETLTYDYLILALGSVPNYYGLPGLEAHSRSLKSLEDATALRNHVIGLLERADVEPDPAERRRQLTFVVTGGGFAGTEMAAELRDLVHSVRRFYRRIPLAELRFVLVHSGARILPELSSDLAAYAQRKLEARGIEFRLQTRVAGATPEGVLLAGGDEIPTRTIVWTAGNQPHPLLRTLPCERNRAGAVIVDTALRVSGLTNVWAVGDCAQIPDLSNQGKPCPPTAQHALRQGAVAADNVAAAIRGRPSRPFHFRTIAVLVALGHRTAVAEVRGRKFSGFLAWSLWRMVYLSKLPGFEKKVRVTLDWLLDMFFPRDIVLTTAGETPILAQVLGIAPERGEGVARSPDAPASPAS